MNQNPNAICWFEIYVDDMERAKKFYSAVLGVTFDDMAVPGGAGDFKMSAFRPIPIRKKWRWAAPLSRWREHGVAVDHLLPVALSIFPAWTAV